MANITPYTNQISQAVYGEEVRSSIINALNKVNDDNNSYQSIKTQVIEARDDVEEAVESFDAKAAAAQTTYNNLVSATNTANTARANLTTATTAANTERTNLTDATTTANTARTNLTNTTNMANATRTQLQGENTSALAHITDLTDKIVRSQEIIDEIENAVGALGLVAVNGVLCAEYIPEE